jgi:hypothetical protein
MTNLSTALAVAVTLVAGTLAATSSALAGQDVTYGWAYPDNFKDQPHIPAQSSGGGSGIPPLYR